MTETEIEEKFEETKEERCGKPTWLIEEMKSMKDLKHKIREKYKKELPQIEESKSATLTQVLTDDMYFRLLIDIMDAAGSESHELLDRLKISQGIKEMALSTSELR